METKRVALGLNAPLRVPSKALPVSTFSPCRSPPVLALSAWVRTIAVHKKSPPVAFYPWLHADSDNVTAWLGIGGSSAKGWAGATGLHWLKHYPYSPLTQIVSTSGMNGNVRNHFSSGWKGNFSGFLFFERLVANNVNEASMCRTTVRWIKKGLNTPSRTLTVNVALQGLANVVCRKVALSTRVKQCHV